MAGRRTGGGKSTAPGAYVCDRKKFLEALCFEKEAEYLEWKRNRGETARFPDTAMAERRERDARREELAAVRLRNRAHAQDTPAVIHRLIPRGKRHPAGAPRSSVERFIAVVRKRSKLLEGDTFQGALRRILSHASQWIRPVEDWSPRTHNIHRQLQSLTRHLFAEYPVPEILDQVWHEGCGNDERQRREWFINHGRGVRLRGMPGMPMPLTRKMEHWLLQAPGALSIEQAVRWAQVRALGGGHTLGLAFAATRLGEQFEDNPFWESVIRFFVAHPQLIPADVGAVVDYLFQKRFVPMERTGANGIRIYLPEQPNLSMHGRTPEALLREVERWHRVLGRWSSSKLTTWPRSGISEFAIEEGQPGSVNHRTWAFRELLSNAELFHEGKTMGHCVASYVWRCEAGGTSVWTLGYLQTGRAFAAVLTIEVQIPRRHISQVKGKRNRHPTSHELGLVRRWAQVAGLTIDSWVRSEEEWQARLQEIRRRRLARLPLV